MKLVFLGTRGNTEIRTRRHRMHSALLVAYGRTRIMVDCGQDWLNRIQDLDAGAILVTHSHPDHARGLSGGAACPVYATAESWAAMSDYPLSDRRVIKPRALERIGGLNFEAFPVDHSIRAPAVGYRITGGARTIFYVPDVVAIRERSAALAGVDVFIGDGAAMLRSLVRRRDGAFFGHTPMRTQLGWCAKERVSKAVFTHCGGEIIRGDERKLGARLRIMARERGVDARIAYDGLEIVLR